MKHFILFTLKCLDLSWYCTVYILGGSRGALLYYILKIRILFCYFFMIFFFLCMNLKFLLMKLKKNLDT